MASKGSGWVKCRRPILKKAIPKMMASHVFKEFMV